MQSEHAHQVTLINWFDATYPQLAGRLFAIPNGGLRHKKVAEMLKMEGVRKGVPDLFLPIPTERYHGLFIEMKKPGGRATSEQKNWISFLESNDYQARICFGFEEAKAVIEQYLK